MPPGLSTWLQGSIAREEPSCSLGPFRSLKDFGLLQTMDPWLLTQAVSLAEQIQTLAIQAFLK